MSVCHELLEELIETIVNQDCEHENYFKCYLCEKLLKSQYAGSYDKMFDDLMFDVLMF